MGDLLAGRDSQVVEEADCSCQWRGNKVKTFYDIRIFTQIKDY